MVEIKIYLLAAKRGKVTKEASSKISQFISLNNFFLFKLIWISEIKILIKSLVYLELKLHYILHNYVYMYTQDIWYLYMKRENVIIRTYVLSSFRLNKVCRYQSAIPQFRIQRSGSFMMWETLICWFYSISKMNIWFICALYM